MTTLQHHRIKACVCSRSLPPNLTGLEGAHYMDDCERICKSLVTPIRSGSYKHILSGLITNVSHNYGKLDCAPSRRLKMQLKLVFIQNPVTWVKPQSPGKCGRDADRDSRWVNPPSHIAWVLGRGRAWQTQFVTVKRSWSTALGFKPADGGRN